MKEQKMEGEKFIITFPMTTWNVLCFSEGGHQCQSINSRRAIYSNATYYVVKFATNLNKSKKKKKAINH